MPVALPILRKDLKYHSIPICVFGFNHFENMIGGKLNARATRFIRHLEMSHRSIFNSIQSLKKRHGGNQVSELRFFHLLFSFFFNVCFFLNKASLKFHTGITVSSLMLLP